MTTPCFRWLSLLLLLTFCGAASGENWPAWRGPRGDGSCSEQGLPTTWSKTENVAWKVALPERGNSTPIVWNDRVFITQTLEQAGRRTLMCFDRQDGRLLWQAGTVWHEKEPTHGTNPMCSASPVTDGERVVAWFGSAGLFCYDFQGNLLWKRDLGLQRHIWGYGSSPVLHGDLCFLNFGPGERSFLIAVNKKTGETVWQHDEPINREGTSEAKFSNADYYGSWSTPLICGLERPPRTDRHFSVSGLFVRCGHRPGTVDLQRHQSAGLHVPHRCRRHRRGDGRLQRHDRGCDDRRQR
jgi:hypothetical protein